MTGPTQAEACLELAREKLREAQAALDAARRASTVTTQRPQYGAASRRVTEAIETTARLLTACREGHRG